MNDESAEYFLQTHNILTDFGQDTNLNIFLTITVQY